MTVDLPSFGEDRTPMADVSLAGNAAVIADVVMRQAEPVVLVGHSLAGVSISAAAELVSDQVRLLVYIAAFLPRDGDSIASLSASPAARRDTGPSAFTRSEDGLSFAPRAEGRPRGVL